MAKSTDEIRDEEREIETEAAYAGGKTESGGKGSKTQKGTNPIEAMDYDPEMGDITTTSDNSMSVAERAKASASEGGDDGIVDVE